MAEKEGANGFTRRTLLQRLSAIGGGAAVYNALAAFHIPPALAAETSVQLPQNVGNNKSVAVLGAGVGGLVAAFELQRHGFQCTVLEANPKVGGRSLTLRRGEVLKEVPEHGAPTEQQCTFDLEEDENPADPYNQPYLNAGPGRIPSAHVHLLRYCKELQVPLEVYIMESRSNLVRGVNTAINRQVVNDARGWIAQHLYRLRHQVPGLNNEQKKAFEELLIRFGALGNRDSATERRGVYARGKRYERSTRSGYKTLPGVEPGEPVEPIDLPTLLNTRFWATSVYQPDDFLWQQTLFQPVGGMDRIVRTLAERFQALGGVLELNAEVDRITRENNKFQVRVTNGPAREYDYCISNIPIPLLETRLQVRFQDDFQAALSAVYTTQKNADKTKRFLANTCKVGWQAERKLWQNLEENRALTVPIFGGISWTSHPMTQLWYPSDRFYATLGVLTGAYNFQDNAVRWGELKPEARLAEAWQGSQQLAGDAFADGLKHGITIAWQNMPFQRGGWAQWENVADGVRHYNRLLDGDMDFYICGDQLSQLPGWQEGAVASAIHAVNAIAGRQLFKVLAAPKVQSVPNSREVVEGL